MNVVPVLAGMELTFFAEDHMVLSFVFLMKIGVITYCSSVVAEQWSHRAEAFTALHAALPTRGWGAPGAGRGHGQDVKCPYPNPRVVTLLPSRFSPHPTAGSERRAACALRHGSALCLAAAGSARCHTALLWEQYTTWQQKLPWKENNKYLEMSGF